MRDLMYEREILRHIEKMNRILDKYSENVASWTETDELAIERALQVLIESVIGIARYCLSEKYGTSVSKSREAFDELRSRGDLDHTAYEKMMKIIGFRNVLVHDYLDVEIKVLHSIMEHKSYTFLIDYAKKVISELENINP